MHRILLLVAVILAILTASLSRYVRAEGAESVKICSVINLIATPERYDGLRVRTVGVAKIGFEADAIYLSPDDARESVMVNGVSLSFEGSGIDKEDKEALHLKRVLVEGTYRSNATDDTGGWRGSISNISIIYSLDDVKME